MVVFVQGAANASALVLGLAVIVFVVSRVARRGVQAGFAEFRAFGLWTCAYCVLAAAEGPGRRADAIRHAYELGSLDGGAWLERHAVGFLESAPQPVANLALWWYSLHLLWLLMVGVGLLVFGDRSAYRRFKIGLLVTGVPALLIFWFYPVASPATAYGLPGGLPAAERGVALPYGAMPSLHVCWALVGLWALWPYRQWRPVALVYSVGTVVVVVLTGNHFLVDCLAGAVLAASAARVLRVLIPANQAAQVPAPRAGAAALPQPSVLATGLPNVPSSAIIRTD